MQNVPKFLALTTARVGMATKAMGAFVKVKLADKCHDKTSLIFISCFFRFLIQTSMNVKREATVVTKMRTVPTFLAHITARAGLATQEMGVFVMVLLTIQTFISFFCK